MSKQLLFLGFRAAREKTDRLFFAIFPDADDAARIAQLALELRRRHELTGKPLRTNRLHISLCHVGDYAGLPEAMVAAAIEAASRTAMPPVEIAFDRAMSFAGRRTSPFVLLGGEGVAALTALQRDLDAAIVSVDPKRTAKKNFMPHMTLLYDRCCMHEQLVEAIRWTAREFVLVHSLLGETRYVPLARFSFGGRPPGRAVDTMAMAKDAG